MEPGYIVRLTNAGSVMRMWSPLRGVVSSVTLVIRTQGCRRATASSRTVCALPAILQRDKEFVVCDVGAIHYFACIPCSLEV